ncbi:uncharacterized protein M6B38_416370 [Iris pallida]|uniref:Uncharacterized protein n=1 Tax=Iris pallida TaxID=29817 RepID=A0AAX6FJ09_IRIPA|nr:uncharacterized protein M6B38_416370 [Iris pallida]
MRKDCSNDYEMAEDLCFVCKDGGDLRVCDYKKCLKAYHSHCVGKGTDFLEEDDPWNCGWHLCSCKKASTFQCFCCPISFCRSCFKSAAFVQVKEKTKGFCNNCLKLAKMIEENRHVDSDGEEVNFKDATTYEFLFKDYWEIVKNETKLTLVDVQAADVLLKRGEKFQNGSDSDKHFESSDDPEYDCDDGKLLFKGLRGKRSRMKPQAKKSRKERTFSSWASEELCEFLSSIGKYTETPQSQLDVTEIIKDYVQSNNLFPPDNKKKNIVIPDEKLRKLFRKKKLKYHKIYDLTKNHLAEENSDLNGEFLFSSEEDERADFSKKQLRSISGHKVHKLEAHAGRKRVSEPPKSSYAAIVVDNIKLVYMRKSLILELLKSPETFESKVVGCFVKVKNDPKDIYYLARKEYQLGQVTGIRKSQHAQKSGETDSDTLLCISNYSNGVKISNLSNDDIEQGECEDLLQLVKKGLFKQPTVADLETKIRSVHEDIMNHWIDREIVKLQKKIDRANEKGWRREYPLAKRIY